MSPSLVLDGDASIPAPGVALQSFSWSVSTPTDPESGQATGRRSYTPITITKRLDQYSPKLMQLVNDNEVLKSGAVTISRSVNGRVAEKLVFKMTNVLITSLHETASDTGSAETVSMQAQKVEMDYTKTSGSPILTTVDPYPPAE